MNYQISEILLGILRMKYCSPNKPWILQQNTVNVCHTVCGLLEKHSRAWYIPIHLLTLLCCPWEKLQSYVCYENEDFPGSISTIQYPRSKKTKTACVIPCIPSGYFSFKVIQHGKEIEYKNIWPHMIKVRLIFPSSWQQRGWFIKSTTRPIFAICILFLQLLHAYTTRSPVSAVAFLLYASRTLCLYCVASFYIRRQPRCRPVCTALLFSPDVNVRLHPPTLRHSVYTSSLFQQFYKPLLNPRPFLFLPSWLALIAAFERLEKRIGSCRLRFLHPSR